MSNQKYNNSFYIGASALIAGILGGLASMLNPTKKRMSWTEDAKDYAQQLIDRQEINSNMILGGLAGGIVAVAATLLLTPKSGSELFEDIKNTFSGDDEEDDEEDTRHSLSHRHHAKRHSKKSSDTDGKHHSKPTTRAKNAKAKKTSPSTKKRVAKSKSTPKVENIVEKAVEAS